MFKLFKKKKFAFSVIIPMYNASTTIEKTLQSIQQQVDMEDKIEIIIVDDCSTDDSFEKVKQLKKKISNIVLLQTDTNSGNPGIPRNMGLDVANGTYVTFIDADDWFNDQAFKTILDSAETYQSDMIVGQTIRMKDKEIAYHANFMAYKERINERPEDVPFFFYYLGPTAKFFRNEIVQQHQIRFNPMKFGEDKLFFIQLYQHIEKLTTLPIEVAYINRYATNSSSVTASMSFILKQDVNFEIIDYLLLHLEENPSYYKKFIQRFFEYDVIKMCDSFIFLRLNKDEQMSIFTKAVKCLKRLKENGFSIEFLSMEEKYLPLYQFLEEERFESYLEYFEWLKKNPNKLFKKENDQLFLTSFNAPYRYKVPILALQVSNYFTEEMYFDQIIIEGDYNRIDCIEIFLRSDQRHFIKIKDFTYDAPFLNYKVPLSVLKELPKGLYTVSIVFDGYKKLNIKQSGSTILELDDFTANFYASKNHNASLSIM